MTVPKGWNSLFAYAWLFIIFVSVFDGYLLVQTREVIGDMERNPAGLMFLAMNGGKVWLFLLMKLFGTILACMLLLMVYQWKPYVGLVIAASVASLQFGLLLYLNFA
ncbi:MAG: hypothetical protein ABL921_35195 [Pirellula sp.]